MSFFMVTHFLAFDPHNCNLPNKVYAISTTSDSPSPPKKGLWDIWSQLLVTWNFFCLNQRQHESNHHKQRFTDHHKHDFSLAVPSSNYKGIKFHLRSAFDDNKFHTAPHSIFKPHYVFLTARGRSWI